jgi:putative flippase GtrA
MLGNFLVVWTARHWQSYEVAVFLGIAVGLGISFVLQKYVAFRSRSWRRPAGEASRFLSVHLLGSAVFWAVAVVVGALALPNVLPRAAAETLGIIAGGATMSVATYLGHRFFTYGTHARPIPPALNRSPLKAPPVVSD